MLSLPHKAGQVVTKHLLGRSRQISKLALDAKHLLLSNTINDGHTDAEIQADAKDLFNVHAFLCLHLNVIHRSCLNVTNDSHCLLYPLVYSLLECTLHLL